MIKKRILILGAAGFVGSNLIRYMLYYKNNYSIFGIDRINDISNIHNVYSNKSNNFQYVDIGDTHIASIILETFRPNIIINLINNKTINDIDNLSNFLIALKLFAPNNFIQLSNISIYKHSDKDILESDICEPLNENDVYTICAENLINIFCKENNVSCNIIRADDPFGPREKKGFIANTYNGLFNDKKIELDNKGSSIRNLIFIEDLSSAIVSIIEKSEGNQIYNVSSGSDFSDLEISFMIKEKLNNDSEILFNNSTTNNIFYKTNTLKIRELGWKPRMPFKEQVFYTIDWYNHNSWFFR